MWLFRRTVNTFFIPFINISLSIDDLECISINNIFKFVVNP
jgi:hypothetical protein